MKTAVCAILTLSLTGATGPVVEWGYPAISLYPVGTRVYIDVNATSTGEPITLHGNRLELVLDGTVVGRIVANNPTDELYFTTLPGDPDGTIAAFSQAALAEVYYE